MPEIVFAFDRKTARSKDADGRMRVRNCILSTAEVNPYRGQEIPGWDKMGLQPNTVYELYRDPEEMRKAVPSFEGIPLMVKHVPQTAENPRKEYQAGAVHSITFDGKHLRGDLLVSDGYAIELIESDELSDLSCGYRYDPVMQSGEADGSKFDGRMRNIQGNHVALVDDGRASGAYVADAALRNPQSPDPSMQQEQAMPMSEHEQMRVEKHDPNANPEGAPAGGTPEGEMNEQNNMAAIGQALKHIAGLLENIHARLPSGDTAGADHGGYDNEFTEGEELEGERTKARREGHPDAGAKDEMSLEPAVGREEEGAFDSDGPPLPNEQEGTPARGERTPHGAMDARTVRRYVHEQVEAARKDERARMARVDQARREVRGVLGDVYGMDSANKIYREALKQVGADTSKMAKGTEQAAWEAYKAGQLARVGIRRQPDMAMDSKGAKAPSWVAALDKISVKG